MNITRVLSAAALATGIGLTSMHAAQASVTATINIVNNNASTAIYHAKNPPSTQSDSFVGVSGWLHSPPDSLTAGASDYTAQVTLNANQSVTFTYGSPNQITTFNNSCTFMVKANQFGNGFATTTPSSSGSGTACALTFPSGHPYNVQVALSGF